MRCVGQAKGEAIVVAVRAAKGATAVEIAGLGVRLEAPIELRSGVTITPNLPRLALDEAANTVNDFVDYAAVARNQPYATFSLRVEGSVGEEALAVQAWNALWDFHLLSLAAQHPCCSLYSVSRGPEDLLVAAANRNIFFTLPDSVDITSEALEWMTENSDRFDALVTNRHFSTAMRCYSNSHYLFDLDMRIMLLWSGIEGLLSVNAELSRRIALYAALIHNGRDEEKSAFYEKVKKSYIARSKAVHGSGATAEQFRVGYAEASHIILVLLRRCVELGRVPSAKEMDVLATAARVV